MIVCTHAPQSEMPLYGNSFYAFRIEGWMCCSIRVYHFLSKKRNESHGKILVGEYVFFDLDRFLIKLPG